MRILQAPGRGLHGAMRQASGYLDQEEAWHAIARLLEEAGVQRAADDLIVKTTQTRRGDPVHVVITLNSAEKPLRHLIDRIAGRRHTRVGTSGVFLLRPDDVRQLVSKVRAK